MEILSQLKKRGQSLTKTKVRRDFFEFIRGLEKYLAEINKTQLNKESKDIFGNPLGFYSKATEFITTNNALLGKGNKIKKAGDPYDLNDTGDFLKSINTSVSSYNILFKATDPKTKDVLKNLLTPDILGLSDEDLNQVINERFLPFFYDYYIKNLLGDLQH